MKRYLLFGLLCTMLAVSALAETHANFEGIPIDGNINQFAKSLKDRGFKNVRVKGTCAFAEGTCLGKENCQVGVSAAPSGKVYMVGVMLPQCHSWAEVFAAYCDQKLNLIRKFGQPTTCIESWNGITQPRTDEECEKAILRGECDYKAFFGNTTTYAILSIKEMSGMYYSVYMEYYDAINNDEYEESQKQKAYTKHPPISFKGMNLGCTLSMMVRHLESLGYVLVKYDLGESALMQGYFHGYQSMVIIGTDKSGYVDNVIWNVIPEFNWRSMYDAFLAVKWELTMDFGFPDVMIDTSDQVSGNYKKIKALKNEKIELRMNYFYEKGRINMWLGYLTEPVVMVSYFLND